MNEFIVGLGLKARQARIDEAANKFRKLWEATESERKKRIEEKHEEEATFEVMFHSQCPFYSCYIFDGRTLSSAAVQNPNAYGFKSSSRASQHVPLDWLREQVLLVRSKRTLGS